MEIFSNKLAELWNKWELRIAVLLSLLLQIYLIGMGSRRKYRTHSFVRIGLWLAYLSADWVATVSLGVLMNRQGDLEGKSPDPDYVIAAFWAPFLLIHLGGPDTITAYSLEDNELWLRHLLMLVVQFGVAFYVFLRSWGGTPLNYLALSVFVAGLTKYGERTWTLMSGSRDIFRDSMLSHPDPGPNYAKFMDAYASKKGEGYKLSLGKVIDASDAVVRPARFSGNNVIADATTLHDAYYFFKTFKGLFAELILSFHDRKISQSFFTREEIVESPGKAFSVLEAELGFMFDVLYTKATIIHSPGGKFLRLITSISTISVFLAFLVIDKKPYSGVDVGITYSLLVGAIALEFYAVLILVSSDMTMRRLSDVRTMLWLGKLKEPMLRAICEVVSFLRYFKIVPANKRWSNSMAQYNLLGLCIKKNPPKLSGTRKLRLAYKLLENFLHVEYLDDIPLELKSLIFNRLLKKEEMTNSYRQAFNLGVEQVLKDMDCHDFKDKLWCSVDVELDQSILLWHIATEICYYGDLNQDPNLEHNFSYKASRWLSEYLLYLLVVCPFMLPNGIGEIRFQDTCAEAREFFQERKLSLDKNQACAKLYRVNTDFLPSEVKGDRSKSVLFDACRLAKVLNEIEIGKKWELISHVWVEMLSCAAANCRWNDHARQLALGGELLTHVWLLMAHLGITEQFQISQGYARAKLQVL